MKNLGEIIVGVKTYLVEKRISLSLKMLFEVPAESLVETGFEKLKYERPGPVWLMGGYWMQGS